MKPKILIGLSVAAALAVGLSAYAVTASAQGAPGYGPGMMDGYGPGYGGNHGPMQGYGPGYHMRGYGAGNYRQHGYGPGYHMRGYGPGMMQGYGYGHGMMGWQRERAGSQRFNLRTKEKRKCTHGH